MNISSNFNFSTPRDSLKEGVENEEGERVGESMGAVGVKVELMASN